MVATLPPTIQLKLDQTLSQWHSWRCVPALTEKPTISHLLSPGLSNYSILVHANKPLVVRIDGLNPATIGLSRQTEWRVLQMASAAGLAPHPRYYNPELGSLVYDYLVEDPEASGESAAAALAATATAAAAHLLRQIHQLPPVHFRLDLRERILRYEKHIEHRGDSASSILADGRSRIMAIIEHTESEGQAQVLCHNDLLQANRILSGGKLRAIDWEYCAMGSLWFDLAVVSVGDALSPIETELLLTSYLGRNAHATEQLNFARHECIYRFIELLWFSALDDPAERSRQLTDSKLFAFQQCLEKQS
jgi:thiamine kinase